MSLVEAGYNVGSMIFIYVNIWFLIALIFRRNDLADIAWGPGIALAGGTALLLSDPTDRADTALLALVIVWAVRLVGRILLRNLKKSEDARYYAWRVAWGKWVYVRSYLQVFILQGALMIVLAYPLIHIAVFGSPPMWSLMTGIIIAATGLIIEVISDYQLDQFKKHKQPGEILQTGLWKYSRHPNYFGEVLFWWGIGIATLLAPMGWVTLISPLAITYLILFVSGIPMLERSMEKNPRFREYQKTTSIFVPWPPKNK